MALLPSDPARQKRLMIGIAPLLLVGAYLYFLHGDYKTRLTGMQTRLERVETNNANARTLSTRSRELEERLLHQSRHDALTGLANRRFFIETLEEVLAFAGEARRRLGELEGYEARAAELEATRTSAQARLDQSAAALTRAG